MHVSAPEATLLNAFRELPPETAGELSALVQRLAAASAEARIDWSDSWSEEDLRQFTESTVRRP